MEACCASTNRNDNCWRAVIDHFVFCSKQSGWRNKRHVANYLRCLTKPLVHVLKSMTDPKLHLAVLETWQHLLKQLVMQGRLAGDVLMHACVPLLPMLMILKTEIGGKTPGMRAEEYIRRLVFPEMAAVGDVSDLESLPKMSPKEALLLLILVDTKLKKGSRNGILKEIGRER